MPKRLKQEGVTPEVAATSTQISAYMSKLGAKGGKVSGARRMEMPKKLRVGIAKRAAAARWAKKKDRA